MSEVGALVTVVIPTKNAEAHLAATLRSVRAQTYPHIEILVSDNGSIDETVSIALENGCRVIRSHGERSTQLNDGIRCAQGLYIYRIDADFILDARVIEECVSLCETGADAVAVHNDSSPDVSFWSLVRNLERKTYRDDDLIVGARFFRAAAIREIGGFDEDLIAAEDYDVHNRLLERGLKIARAKCGEIHMGEPRTLAEIWNKSYFYGLTIRRYVKRYPGRAAAQFFPIRISYLRHWRDLAAHPVLTFGLLVVIATKMVAAGSAAFVEAAQGIAARVKHSCS